MAKGRWETTTRLIETAYSILEQQQPMTIRQLFYRLVSSGEIENSLRDYKRVSSAMTKARESEEIPWAWIVDRSRPTYARSTWNDLEEYGEAVQRCYRRDNWQDQPCYVEIWVEKDAIVGSINDLAEEFAVPVRAIRGFCSTTVTHQIAELFETIDKPIHVFYLGDHDPSGREIESDVESRVWKQGDAVFDVERLAIHAADIERFNLPPLRVKEQDSRAPWFHAIHGDDCVELDALPADELRRRIRESIEGVLDHDAWNRAKLLEQTQRESTKRFAEALRSLPRQQDEPRADA